MGYLDYLEDVFDSNIALSSKKDNIFEEILDELGVSEKLGMPGIISRYILCAISDIELSVSLFDNAIIGLHLYTDEAKLNSLAYDEELLKDIENIFNYIVKSSIITCEYILVEVKSLNKKLSNDMYVDFDVFEISIRGIYSSYDSLKSIEKDLCEKKINSYNDFIQENKLSTSFFREVGVVRRL